MYVALDPDSPMPLYEQLHHSIVEAIANGDLAAGQRLDSIRRVAASFGINPATVKKAYDLLEEQNLVSTSPRSGTVVNPRPTRISAQHRAELEDTLKSAVELGFAQGARPADLLKTFEAILASTGKQTTSV